MEKSEKLLKFNEIPRFMVLTSLSSSYLKIQKYFSEKVLISPYTPPIKPMKTLSSPSTMWQMLSFSRTLETP